MDFEYIPVIQDTSKMRIQVASCAGFSTRQAGASTGGGRLYGTLEFEVGFHTATASFYRDTARSDLLVATVVPVADVGAWITTDATADGEIIRFRIKEFNGATAEAVDAIAAIRFIAIVSFAVDADVASADASLALFPGYDAEDGLAHYHALAMREILTVDLPARVPNLFGGLGLATFLSAEPEEVELPDLRTLVNADALRMAQAALTKAMSAEENEHQQEWRDIAEMARARYAAVMDSIEAANAPKESDAADTRPDESVGTSFGRFNRG